MNEKIGHINARIDKLKSSIVKNRLKIKELERERQDIAEAQIVAEVRKLNIKPEDVGAFLKQLNKTNE